MKLVRTSLALAALSFLLSYDAVSAPQTVIPNTPKGVLAEIRKQKTQLDSAVTKRETDQVKAIAKTMTDLANALPAHASAGARDRVTTVSKRLNKYSDHLAEAVQENDAAGVATYSAGLQKQIDALSAEFP